MLQVFNELLKETKMNKMNNCIFKNELLHL